MTNSKSDYDEMAMREQDASNDFISRFLHFSELEQAAEFAEDRSIYNRKLDAHPPQAKYDKIPHTIYLYIVGIEPDGRVFAKHYQQVLPDPIPYVDLDTAVQTMLDGIASGDLQQDVDSNFRNIEWKHKSYIVFILDEEYWTLQNEHSKLPPVRFKAQNHSFFDAKDLTVLLRDAPGDAPRARTGVAFVNHMKKDSRGNNLTAREPFHFEIIFDLAFAGPPHGRMIVIFDPDGTNIGPPLPPPEEP